jgi:hypothetical protein
LPAQQSALTVHTLVGLFGRQVEPPQMPPPMPSGVHGGTTPPMGQQSAAVSHDWPAVRQTAYFVQRGTPRLSCRQQSLGWLLQLSPAGMSAGWQQLLGKLHASTTVLQTWPGFEQLFSPLQRPNCAPEAFEQPRLPDCG